MASIASEVRWRRFIASSVSRVVIAAVVLAATVGAWAGIRGSGRPSIGSWASGLQASFDALPNVNQHTTVPASRRDACIQTVAILKRARRQLVPAPTRTIERAFLDYTDALLDLYRECPKSESRARTLHDRANMIGVRFEELVNRAVDGAK